MTKPIARTASIALLAGLAFGSPAAAHGVVSETFTLGVVDPGETAAVTLTCPHHHYVMSGGYDAVRRIAPAGPMVVTASYPASTRSWTVELENRSGRPTGVNEAQITVFAMCDHHW